jgi:hypothetical protein
MDSLNNETHVTPEQRKFLKELIASGHDVVLQMIPTSKAVRAENVL